MKKRIIALISFLCYIICWAQAADEHYYFKNLSIQGWVIPDYSQCYYTGQEGIYVVWYQGWTEPIRWDVIPEL